MAVVEENQEEEEEDEEEELEEVEGREGSPGPEEPVEASREEVESTWYGVVSGCLSRHAGRR